MRAICGHDTSEGPGIVGGAFWATGDTIGINFALGESAATVLVIGVAGFVCLIQPVRPKNFAM